MKKTVKLLTLLLALIFALSLTACGRNPVTVDKDSVIITARASEYQIEGKKLLDFMETIREDGKIDFTVKDGMITSVNGRENGLSSFWMIYTDDTEYSNSAWGEVEYQGKKYFSASLGICELPVKDGATYILIYQSF